MKFLLLLGFYCHFIRATQLENNNNDLYEEKTKFENLSDGPLQEITSHLYHKDKIQFSSASKELLKYDPSEVVLTLPLEKSKVPSLFLCEHLKTRKNLLINMKENFDDDKLIKPKSLTMKYFQCLTGIEKLRFGEYADEAKILGDSLFKIHDLFPKLEHMELHLDVKVPLNVFPNTLKSMKLYYSRSSESNAELDKKIALMKPFIKEKIGQMKQLETLAFDIHDYSENGPSPLSIIVEELKSLPKFKRLSINFAGRINGIRDILAHMKQARYFIDLKVDFPGRQNLDILFDHLPKTIDDLNLKVWSIDNTEKICDTLSTLDHLKILIIKHFSSMENFGCLLKSLPPSLTELKYDGFFKTSDIDINAIVLPKNLHSVNLRDIKANVFNALANQVLFLETSLVDPDNLLKIEKPLSPLKNLILKRSFAIIKQDAWLHLLDLLPMHMDSVQFETYFYKTKDFHIVENKILSMEKNIKHFTFSAVVLSEENHEPINEVYVFDGTKMIKQK